MAAVNISSVRVLDNPAPFLNPLQFEIEYDCVSQLQEDLEWKLTYVGSAETEKYDQVLDAVLVGPVFPGTYRFVFQSNAPDTSRIPVDDLVGVTVIFLSCSYKTKEFVRVGYYVNNEYVEEELRENPPEKPLLDKLQRSILADHPRVTKFPCEFDNDMEQQQQQLMQSASAGETQELSAQTGAVVQSVNEVIVEAEPMLMD